MATVATTTQTDVLAPPDLAAFARDSINGRLYVLARTTSVDTLTLYRSTDSGGSWASFSSFTHTGIQEWSSLVVDKNGYAHIAYRLGTVTADSLWYRRCNLNSGTWSGGLQITATDANGGTIGSRWQGVDIAVVRNPNGTYAIYIPGAYADTTPRWGIWTHGVSIDAAGVIYNNDGIILNNRIWLTNGTIPGRSGVTCEVEHSGDGFTSSTPHIWVTWGRTTLRMVKLSWQGSSVGWSGPTSYQTIKSVISASDYASGRWDGKQWLMAVVNPDDNTTVRVYQRNQANTITTTFDTPTHPTGVVRYHALSYDAGSRDIRIYAVGTSTSVLYFIDYDRTTSLWSTWATVTATAILGATEWGVRRGGSSGNAKMDIITSSSGAPNTITHTAMSASSTPNIATWDLSSSAYFNGGAADVGASLLLDWNFVDPDPGQGQGSYALSRQIGAGAVQYYTAAGGTWGATEVQNATATTSVTLASGWAAGTDANYTFRVKVWDSTNIPAVDYSAALILIPSVKVNPTITAPTAAQVLNTDTVTMTWTVSEQTAYRVRLSTNPGGQVVYDSGFISDSASTSFQVPYRMANGTGWTIELTTKNLEGLASTAQTKNFTVSYAAPPAVYPSFTPDPAHGVIQVVSNVLAPVGAQPSIISMELWRRKMITPTLNGNGSFDANVAGYVAGGGGTAPTLTYSTTQSHSSPGAARLVPAATGGAAFPDVEWSTPVDVVMGSAYLARAWVRPDTANKPVQVALMWFNSSGTFLSSTVFAVAAPVALAWHFLMVTGDPSAVANAAKVSVGAGCASTPASTDAFYVDDVALRVYNPDVGTRVAQGVLPGTTVSDSQTASIVEYEYQWIATGSNGTSISGPWTQ